MIYVEDSDEQFVTLRISRETMEVFKVYCYLCEKMYDFEDLLEMIDTTMKSQPLRCPTCGRRVEHWP